jgi:hypothetical protein
LVERATCHEELAPSELVVQVAIQLVDVLSLDLPHILQLEDELTRAVPIVNVLEEIE